MRRTGPHETTTDDPQQQTPDEAELVRRFWDRLRLFAARHLGDESAAEDVAQETLRRVIEARRARRVRNPDALPAFVFETARNICLHKHRSLRREIRALSRLSPGSGDAAAPDPLRELVSEERRTAVRRALDGLEQDDRELLRSFYYEGIETVEVARRLDVSPGAVRVRKHRALQRLRELLNPSGS